MNWGHKITLVFIAFAAMMIYMVVRSFQANVDLVSEDYYLDELNYQQQIDKKKNVRSANMQVIYQLTTNGLELTFPNVLKNNEINGTISLYRPSEASMDIDFAIGLDSLQKQIITPSNLAPGKYLLKIDWSDGETPYYQESELLIPGA